MAAQIQIDRILVTIRPFSLHIYFIIKCFKDYITKDIDFIQKLYSVLFIELTGDLKLILK